MTFRLIVIKIKKNAGLVRSHMNELRKITKYKKRNNQIPARETEVL